MHRLTREVRFAVNPGDPAPFSTPPTNGHAGYPSLTGLTGYLTVRAHFVGPLQPDTQYLLDIKRVDTAVRAGLPPVIQHLLVPHAPAPLLRSLFDHLSQTFGPILVRLDALPSPFVCWSLTRSPMIRFSQKFEFSAAHRLHNPDLTEEQNRLAFGKCNNPAGHGHNYEVQVTVTGLPNPAGRLVDVPAFEQLVNDVVIDRFDHKFLNLELAEFHDTIPSVENIARVIFDLLKPHLRQSLASVTVWETPKTWCEYTDSPDDQTA